MRSTRITIAVLFCAVCVSGIVAAAETDETAAATQQGPCCFENPRFSGTCQVTPGSEESCGSILSYLNNPNSVGKTYCGNTKVRGGWSSVACEGAALTISAESCGDSRE
jgi:hypothetical protein